MSFKIECKIACDGCGKETDGQLATKDPGAGSAMVMFGMVADTPKWDVWAPKEWGWATYSGFMEQARIGFVCSKECGEKVMQEYKAKRAADAEEYRKKSEKNP